MSATPTETSVNPFRPHPDASALTAFRVVKRGYEIRAYTVVESERGWQGIEHILRTAWAVGYISKADGSEYAVLSVLDDDNTELQELGVPNARAWAWWYRRLGLRVASTPDGCDYAAARRSPLTH